MFNQAKDWLTVAQFITRYKGTVSRNPVYEGIKDGSIPSIRISRRKILIPEDALERKLAGALGHDN